MKKHSLAMLVVLQLAASPKIFSQTTAFNTKSSLKNAIAQQDESSSKEPVSRMDAVQVSMLVQPQTGLIIYNTTINAYQINAGTSAKPSWQTLSAIVGDWLAKNSDNNSSASNLSEPAANNDY